MREADYLKLKQRIEANYRRDLEALERVWKLSGGSMNGKSHPNSPSADTAGKPKGQLVKGIKEFLQSAAGEFSISDIQATLLRQHPELGEVRRQSIATALRRQQGIETVSAGKGRAEAKYRKV